MPRTVLVVDDSTTMRHIMENALRDAGWQVLSAANGRAAMDVWDRQAIDLLITDWNMPEMNGLDLIRAVRACASGEGTPILVLTTETSEDDKNAARQAGATGWLSKPVDAATLIEISSVLVG